MSWIARLRTPLTAVFALGVMAAMAVVLAGHRDEFLAAMEGIPYWTLLCATGLHGAALVARSEAFAVCVKAAGGTMRRRLAFQVAAMGFAANIVTTSLGLAVRIAALRRFAPERSPGAGTLLAAEVPVVGLQFAFGCLMSFTLIGPLGLPWWTALIVAAGAIALVWVLRYLARHHDHGLWRGLAALRSPRDRARVSGCVAIVIGCEVVRNLLLLQAVGLHPSLLDAVAMLIGAGLLGVLPIGPGTGAGAAMLIFGATGVAPAAAAGILLTATGVVADLLYASWGAGDMLWRSCPVRTRRVPLAADMAAVTAVSAAAVMLVVA